MLLKIAVLIAVGLCVGWMVPVYRKRERKKQIVKAIVALSAMPLDRIPDVASGFRRFVKEVHGVDLREMTYDQQVDYVQKNLFTLWRPELNVCIDIPMSGELEWGIVIFGVGAWLGELVCSRQTAQWKKNSGEPLWPPFLEVECCGGSVVPCQPFEMLLSAFSEKDATAVAAEMIPFESREILDNSIRTFHGNDVYSPEEMETFAMQAERTFGKIRRVFHEKNSPDMHIDVYIIEPTERYPALRLLTCGMGARVMEIEEEFREVCPDRLELMIDLPTDWPLEMESLRDERNFWPIRILKILARFPWDNETWLGFGHAIPWPEPFAENTKLTGVLLGLPAVNTLEESEIEVSPGKKVQIFQVIPIYQEEMDYKVENDADKLFELWGDSFSYVVDPQRRNGVTGA